MRLYLFAAALFTGAMPAMAQVPPKLAQTCSSAWPDHYELQAVCLRQQLETLEKLARQDTKAPAPPSKKARRIDWTLCRVDGLQEILFTTRTNWSPAEDGTQLTMGGQNTRVTVDAGSWSTEDYVFRFDKPTKKRRIDLTVESQGDPMQRWAGFCITLDPRS